MTKKMSIIGAATNGNVGAAMMVEAIEKNFKGFNIALFSHYPNLDLTEPKVDNLRIFDGRPLSIFPVLVSVVLAWKIFPPFRNSIEKSSKTVRFLLESKVCLDVSGISFSDGRLGPLIYNSAILVPFFLMGIPVIKMSQAIGPSENLSTRIASRIFLSRCEWVFARGSSSLKNAQKYCPERSSEAADLVFSFAGEELIGKSSDNTTVVIPSRVVQKKYDKEFGSGSYVELMKDFCLAAARESKVVLLPFAVLPNSVGHNNDFPLCQEIGKSAGIEVLKPNNLSEYRKALSDSSRVVTGRFHGMITAVSVMTQALVTSWGHKYEEAIPQGAEAVSFIGWASMNKANLIELNKGAQPTKYKPYECSSLSEAKKSSVSQFSLVSKFLDD